LTSVIFKLFVTAHDRYDQPRPDTFHSDILFVTLLPSNDLKAAL